MSEIDRVELIKKLSWHCLICNYFEERGRGTLCGQKPPEIISPAKTKTKITIKSIEKIRNPKQRHPGVGILQKYKIIFMWMVQNRTMTVLFSCHSA